MLHACDGNMKEVKTCMNVATHTLVMLYRCKCTLFNILNVKSGRNISFIIISTGILHVPIVLTYTYILLFKWKIHVLLP